MTATARTGHDGRCRAILALDTATSRCIVATASPAGVLDGVTTWPAGYRHGETLLPTIGRTLGEQNIRRSRLTAIVVGTGPGAFTGLRVGLATAKTLAASLGIPLVGVSTGEALLVAAATVDRTDRTDPTDPIDPTEPGPPDGPVRSLVLLLPAGPSDRLLVRPGHPPRLLPGGTEPEVDVGEVVVALDLAERAAPEALERGERAWSGFPAALVRLGVERLAAGDVDDPALLVPEYVTLPRGISAQTGEVTWSRDLR